MQWGALFDWDGTVVDSSAAHERSWELLAKEAGYTLPPDHFQRSFGMVNRQIIPHILEWTSDAAEIQRLSDRKEALYREVVARDGVTVLPGARELLEALQAAHVPCAVGTSTDRANVELVFQTCDLGQYFQAVVASEDVTLGKPDPEVFLRGAAALNLEPAFCIVFEDAGHGVEAGNAAGMLTVAVTTTRSADRLAMADHIVPSLADLQVPQLAEWLAVWNQA